MKKATESLSWLKRCESLMDGVAQLARALGSLSSLVFITILFIQVALRYLFNSPIYGIEETVIALMVWYSSLGTAVVYWEKGHAAIIYFLKFLPRWFQIAMLLLSELIVLATSVVFVYSGVGLFRIQFPTMPVGGLAFSRAFYYALPVVFMGVLMTLFSLYRTLEFILLSRDDILAQHNQEGGVVIE